MSFINTVVMGKNTELFGGKDPKKFIVQGLAVIVFLCGLFYWFEKNYRFGAPKNNSACIDGFFFITDLHDQEPKRDKLFKYTARGIDTLIPNPEWRDGFEDGAGMMKFMRGMPGDTVEVTTDQVFINGEPVEGAQGLALYKTLGKESPDAFHTTITLAENEYYFLGTNYDSYDSRYWGPVQYDQIVGRAYVLFK